MPRPKGMKHDEASKAKMRAAWVGRPRLIKEHPDFTYHQAWKMYTRFGMSPHEYLEMLEKQDGVCAICGNPPGEKLLSIDHDHVTGDVRGLLCQPCNLSLGVLEENIDSAVDYLRGGD